MRSILVCTIPAIALLVMPLAAEAQAAVGIRYGQGEGSANYNMGDIHGRVRITGPLYLTAAYQTMGGAWDCAGDPNATCGYDGHSISAGGAVAALDNRRTYFAFSLDLGTFVRSGSFANNQYAGNRHATASAGAEGEVTLVGPVRLQMRLAHRRIFDRTYRQQSGHTPHVTSLSAGLSISLWRSRL